MRLPGRTIASPSVSHQSLQLRDRSTVAEACNEVSLTGDEVIDSVPQRFDLSVLDVLQLLLDGSDVSARKA